jgi:hypothetical protein
VSAPSPPAPAVVGARRLAHLGIGPPADTGRRWSDLALEETDAARGLRRGLPRRRQGGGWGGGGAGSCEGGATVSEEGLRGGGATGFATGGATGAAIGAVPALD